MSENIGKHLIEISRYDSATYRGVVTKETEQTWGYTYRKEGPRRKFKEPSDVLISAASDPDAALVAYRATYQSFRDEADDLQRQLTDAKQRRLKASIAALKAAQP